MAVSIYALKRGLADVAIPVGDDELHVTYRPGVITPGFNEASYWDLPTWISRVVESWDLEEDSGEVVPLRKQRPPTAGETGGAASKAAASAHPSTPAAAAASAQDALSSDAPNYVPSDELRGLPSDFLLLVQREINRDLLPGKRLRATSAGGSKPAA